MNDQPRSQYDATRQGTAGPALEQVRQTAQALVAEGRGGEALDFVLSALAAVLSKSRELELQVAKLLRERVGRTSERVDPGQLALLFQELVEQMGPEAGVFDPDAEARQDEELQGEIEREKSKQPKGRGRGKRKGRGGWRTQESVRREVHLLGGFAHLKAFEMKLPGGLGEGHWQVLEFLRGEFHRTASVPTVIQTCNALGLELEDLEELFPDGYNRGAVKMAGLRPAVLAKDT